MNCRLNCLITNTIYSLLISIWTFVGPVPVSEVRQELAADELPPPAEPHQSFLPLICSLSTRQHRDCTCRSVTSGVIATWPRPSKDNVYLLLHVDLRESISEKKEWDLHHVLLRTANQARNRVGSEVDRLTNMADPPTPHPNRPTLLMVASSFLILSAYFLAILINHLYFFHKNYLLWFFYGQRK